MGFSTDLWDQFELVYKRVQEGKKWCHSLSVFLKKRSELEKDYAKKLQALTKSTETEFGTMHSAWVDIKTETDNVAKAHQLFGEDIGTLIQEPIDTLLKGMVKQRRTLRDAGRKILKDLKSAEEHHSKAKTKFEQCRKKQDEAQEQYEKESFANANSAAAKKLASKVATESKSAAEADQQYTKGVQALKALQEKAYDSELPKILDELEDLERNRMSSMKGYLEKYVELQAKIPPESQQSCTKMQNAVNAVNIGGDLDGFVAQTKTGKHKPPKVEYEPYDSKLGACRPSPSAVEYESRPSGPSRAPSVNTMTSQPVQPKAAAPAATPTPTPAPAPTPSASNGASYHDAGSSQYIGKARALFDYTATDDGELSFKEGELINIILKDPSGWWQGELNGVIGVFPSVDWVQEVTDDANPFAGGADHHAPPSGSGTTASAGKYKALYRYPAEADYELTINEGDILSVESEQDGWFFGSNDRGESGKFPSNYVEKM
jgi:hypothetical protein